jgi:PilZ domain
VACPPLDRRQHLRFRLRAPVNFSWREAQSEKHGEGFSRDISGQGIFVVSDEPPPPKDTVVHLEVLLPSRDTKERELWLRAIGPVVRSARDGDKAGFAVGAKFILGTILLVNRYSNGPLESTAAN